MKRKDILQANNALLFATRGRLQIRLPAAFGIVLKTAFFSAVFAASCLAQFDGGGPSILSRGGARPGQSGGKPINFNFYAGLSGTFVGGSIPIETANGGVRTQNLYGGSLNGGLTGSHAWKSSALGIDYRGSYNRYNRNSYGNGSEQAIDLQYTIQATRRLIFRTTLAGGSSTFANSSFISPTTILDPGLIGIPTNDIFDNRLYYVQANLGMTYRKSARLAFTFSGDGFTVHRAAKALVGVNGYRASAQVVYQWSRRDQVGVGYNFTHFSYPRAFGASDLHGVNFQYGRKLAPGLQLTVAGGAFRIETLGAAQVSLSPEIAEILGQTTAYQAIYRVNYVPQFSFGISYARAKSSFSASAGAGATPGNGVYLTSKSEYAGAGYSYSGIRKTSLSFSGGASQYSSVFQSLQAYRNYYANGMVSYVLTRHLSASFQTDLRTYSINGRNRFGESVSLGLYWSPTEIPIPGW